MGLLGISTLIVCGLAITLAAAPSLAEDFTVDIDDGNPSDVSTWGYSPREISIAAGQSITWTNSGRLAHSATATGGQFDTGLLDPGDSSTITLSSAGTIAYQCSVHPTMTGTVIVQAAGAAPAAQVQPSPTPFRFATPTPLAGASSSVTTTTARPAPRAGGLPLELALPMVLAGASALGGGIYVLRRGR
jgi:plastocyanin